jgi:uncharacterized protein (TIGR02246 family)
MHVSQSDDASWLARLQKLEDAEEIRTLLLSYGRFLDARRFKEYADLFAPDGEWVGGFGSVQGRAAIQTFMERMVGTGPPTPGGKSYHLLTNFFVDVQGDTATAQSRWAFVMPSPEGRPMLAMGGHYDDFLVRIEGRWKLRRRVALTDIPADPPGASGQPK